MTVWLHIVGMGPEGLAGLAPPARAVVAAADVVIGADHPAAPALPAGAELLPWPAPTDLVPLTAARQGRRSVVLAPDDAAWSEAATRLGRAVPPAQIAFHPPAAAFRAAAERMGWSLAETETLTVPDGPVEQMVAFLQPDQKLLILVTGPGAPARIARFLSERGFGESRMTLASGGALAEATAAAWAAPSPAFAVLAVDCVAAPDAALLPRVPGLDDALFRHDGTVTRREVRAATLAKLMPMRGALLWDVGTGAGSIAIEWMRAARYARAIGIEPRADRRMMAAANALALGTPKLELVAGEAPAAFEGLPAPDAICLGGGLSEAAFEAAWTRLRPLGRLVANGLTAADEALLRRLHARRGGDLVRLGAERAAPPPAQGWQPVAPVVQWSVVRR